MFNEYPERFEKTEGGIKKLTDMAVNKKKFFFGNSLVSPLTASVLLFGKLISFETPPPHYFE